MSPTPPPDFDVEKIRRDFPILNKPLANDKTLVYLDNAASTQKPNVVIQKEIEVYENYFANAYRGDYEFGIRIDDELENSRSKVQQLIGARSNEEIIFTSGTTFSINLVAYSWGRKFLQPGDEILLTELEHHANLVPWQRVAQETGATLRFIPITDDGRLDLTTLDQLLHEKTRLVAITAMSNVLGTITPISQIAAAAKKVGATILVDAAQAVPHQPIHVTDPTTNEPLVDFLAFSGHKIYGPTGIGILYGRRELLETMDPFLAGGHMVDRVEQQQSTWANIPAKFEAGTLPIAQAIALAPAIDYVTQIGFDVIAQHETALLETAHQKLQTVPGLQIHGPSPAEKGAIVCVTMDGAHPQDLAFQLNRCGVAVRYGHHCAMPLHDRLNVPATLRLSFALYNKHDEIDAVVDAFHYARKRLRLTP